MPSFELNLMVELPEDFGTFQAAEKKVFDAVRQAGKELIAKVMLGYEDHLFHNMPIQKKDRRHKTYETPLFQESWNLRL
ncbi:MAG: hypothetical protein HQM16_06460 [Deltaproteobacteria bacterium]|nr:hypothetical protein [Deltaproteobacteria bacterium]